MPYKLELNPATLNQGDKVYLIQITDIALHVDGTRATGSVGKKIKKAFEKGTPGRLYSPINTEMFSQEKYLTIAQHLNNDPDFIQFVADKNKEGYRVILGLPKAGVPIVPGEDTIKFINSTKGKRILRRLYKNRPQE